MAIKKSDLYSSIWASCDELRGGMDASQYKDYVLFMLFIKYISGEGAIFSALGRKKKNLPYGSITVESRSRCGRKAAGRNAKVSCMSGTSRCCTTQCRH